MQAVHHLFIGVGRFVVDESGGLFGSWGQSGQIERDPADQGAAVGFGRGMEIFARQARLNEGVDRIRGACNLRRRAALYRLVRPVALVLCALRNPLADGRFLRGREFLMHEGRRHDARAFGEHALDDRALVGVAGHNRSDAALGGFDRLVSKVEPHARHSRTLVGAMTAEAGLRHDGPDIAIEADFRGRRATKHRQKYPDRLPQAHSCQDTPVNDQTTQTDHLSRLPREYNETHV